MDQPNKKMGVCGGEESGQVEFGTFMLPKYWMEPGERHEARLKRFSGDRWGRSIRSLDFIRRAMRI